jgi:hypothetical protein
MSVTLEEIREILKEVALLQKQYAIERQRMQERDAEAQKSTAETQKSIVEMRQTMRENSAETQKSTAETQKSIVETQKSIVEMRQTMRENSAETQKSIVEMRQTMRENSAEMQKSIAEIWQHIETMQSRTDKQIAQVNKQLGEMGNKWGTFTEGLSIASVEKIVKKLFKVTHFSPNAMRTVENEHIEIDALGIANGDVEVAVLVEVKSHLRKEDLQQLTKIIHKFPKMYPEYKSKKLYAVIACIYAPKNLRHELRKQGIYLVMPQDNILQVIRFEEFTPKNFNTKFN